MKTVKTVTDPVFGELKYKHSWKGACTIPGLGQIEVTAQAYPGEEVSDAQRDAFQQFRADSVGFLSSANEVLLAYASRVYPGTDVSQIRPEGILFRQNGVWGFVYPSPIGEDDGISVRFENGQVIADSEDALF
jgi:hypothetical protein